MRSKMFLFTVLLFWLMSCDENTDTEIVPDMTDPDVESGDLNLLKRGTLTSYEHNLQGAVALYEDSLEMKVIRLEEFFMTEGPDVRVYISKSNNYSNANTIEIGKLKESYSNQRITIPVANYPEEYKFVLVYCLEFHSLFGYAELKE